MAESVYPYALTTLQRVKDRIFDTNLAAQPTAFDSVLTRMINSVTDYYERETGARRFAQTTYTNEIYSAYGARQKRIVTRQAPIINIIGSGNMIGGQKTITNLANTTSIVVGMPILADNLPPGTTVSSIDSGTQITVSQAAKATQSSSYFQISGLIKFQWRPGTPDNPSWIDFLINQYEVINDGRAGVIRVYGVLPRLYNNMIRMTYSAGYAIDWPNAGNGTTHTLPSDLSDSVENVVVRRFKRRQLAGKGSEALEGATTAWNKELDSEDIDVIGHYRRVSTIF